MFKETEKHSVYSFGEILLIEPRLSGGSV